MVRYKWTMLLTMLIIALMTVFLLQGAGRTKASGDFSDPFLDPYALSLTHRHTGPGIESAEEKGVQMQLSWPQGEPEADVSSRMSLSIKNSDGKPIEKFDITNEKLLHLIVVSDDLQQFQHIHPEYKGGGVFEVSVSFPAGGAYKLYADFLPAGMNELTRIGQVTVKGETPERPILNPSETLSASVDGIRVTLGFDETPVPQTQTSMTYTFTDEKSGKPVTDLELYLGAVGHAVAIDKSAKQFIHIHPLNWASSGPQAVFGVSFPSSGLYKIWGQFQRNGKPFVVPFVIEV